MHAVVDRAIPAFDCNMFFADAGIDRHLAGRYCWSQLLAFCHIMSITGDPLHNLTKLQPCGSVVCCRALFVTDNAVFVGFFSHYEHAWCALN